MWKFFAIFVLLAAAIAQGNGQKLTHSAALSRIRAAGVDISSSGGCSDRTNKRCTSLEQIRESTINGVVTLKRASGCPLTISGGTEVGHSTRSTQSHANGYKVDYRLNTCLSNYIRNSFTSIENRGDGARQYRSSAGNTYALEGNHWDVTYV